MANIEFLTNFPNFQKIVEINAGAALYLGKIADNLKEGFDLAKKVFTDNHLYKIIRQELRKFNLKNMYSEKNYFQLGLKVKNNKSVYRGFEIVETPREFNIYKSNDELLRIIKKDKTLSPQYNIVMAQGFIDNHLRKEN